MAQVFKTRVFASWARDAGLSDQALCDAVEEMRTGLVDARLGGGLVKKRVPLPGRGKRGGARTLLATNLGDRWFYVFGFPKNERDDVNPRELKALRLLAGDLLALTPAQCAALAGSGGLEEICHDQTHERHS